MAYDSANNTKTKTIDTPFQASNDADTYYIEQPDYTDKESQYRSWLLATLERDRNRRESPHIEFNGLTYTQNYRANMLAANSYTPPRANAEDTQVVTGTTREKVLAIVSSVLNLNFESKFMAFNQDDIEDEELAEAMTDCVERSLKLEMWDDKKLYAYFEMAVQGDCYMEEQWVDEMITEKKKINISDVTESLMKDYKADYKHKVTISGARRSLIPGTQVYKGSMTERDFTNQPHIFTREVRPYEVAKSIYGKLPRWKNVPRRLVTVGSNFANDFPYGINWRLETTEVETCEIIKYQDKWNDEYQLIINGVMMLPVGFPLPWNYPQYNIIQGRLEPIGAFFSESKSIPTKTKLDQEILDEMYRLAVLKTQKSFMPPIANYSTNILARSAFLPGKVNNNMQKGDIEVLGGNPQMYSMQPSEFDMIKLVKQFIDEKSIAPIISGQQQGGDPTATEINTTMQQAKQQLGLLIFGFIQFHQNADLLRLYNLLDNLTQPIDTKLEKVANGVTEKNVFRSMSINKQINGKGMGTKIIDFTEKHKKPYELMDEEEGTVRDPKTLKPISSNPPKRPIKRLQVSPSAVRSIQYTWHNEVVAKERDTTISDRISFEDRLTKAYQLWGPQSVNADYAQTQWAHKVDLDPHEFFQKQQNPLNSQMPQMSGGQTQPGMQQGPGALQESNLNKQARPFSSGAGPAEAMRQGMGK